MRRGLVKCSATLRGVVGMVLGLGLAVVPAFGQFGAGREGLPAVRPAEAGYAVRHWTVADGLPGQSITALAQTPDGYLWCGTSDALVRYDGTRFRTFFGGEVAGLGEGEIGHLSVDGGGRLWIWGGQSSLSVLEDGSFRQLGEGDGLATPWIGPVTNGSFGDCWLVSSPEDGLHRYDGGRFVKDPQQPGATGSGGAGKGRTRLHQVWADASGPRWAIVDRLLEAGDRRVANRDRRLMGMDAAGMREVEVTGKGPDFQLERLFTMPDGTAALASRDGIYVVRDGAWMAQHRFDRSIPRSHGSLRVVVADGRGNYWVGTNDGGLVLSRADRVTRRLVLPEEERRPMVGSLCVDGAGNLWAGSRDGLYQVVRKAARSWGRAEGMPEGEVVAISEGRDGRIWMAGEEALVPVSPDGVLGEPQMVPRDDDLVQRVVIQRLAPSADGSLWVAMRSFRVETQRWHHDMLRAKSGGFVFVSSVEAPVRSLHELEDGSLLVGTTDGLFASRGGTPVRVPLPDLKDGERPQVTAMTTDAKGRVVAGVLSAGLFRREAGGWKRLTRPGPDDRQGRQVRSLDVGPDGTIWAGCGRHGLACWQEGTWKSFAGLKERLPREITGVAADDTGGIWLTSTTGEGLVRLDGTELLAWWDDRTVDPTATHFGRPDGLPSIVAQAGYSPVHRDGTGRIWIATKLGAAVVRPEEWQRRREEERPPEVHLESVGINDQLAMDFLSGTDGGAGMPEVVVPPGPRRVEFRYVGIDLTAPEEVRYRYRLEGLEEEWTEAGDRAVAVYPDLPPGRYEFRVAAAGRFGLWNETGAGAVLVVQPRWWERTGMRVLGVALVLGLLSLGYVFRLRRIQAKTAMQEEFSRALIWSQEAERKRLASELHDGLGHELLVLKGGIDRELVQQGADGTAAGKTLSSKAREVIHQVREISHDLRPPELERYGIAPALESAALATAELTGIELTIALDAPERRLRPVVEISLFRIAQEALSNMARHSDASEGRVELSHGGESVTLVLEDDGRGFDPGGVERARRGPGLGLAGMEERVHLLGGTWECRSEPGNGTRITVTVPVLYREEEVEGPRSKA